MGLAMACASATKAGAIKGHMPGFRAKPPDSLHIADQIGRRNPLQQAGEIDVGETVVERDVGDAGGGSAEQGDRGGFATLVEQRNMRAAALYDAGCGALRRAPKFAI